jgi:hypothetical protein
MPQTFLLEEEPSSVWDKRPMQTGEPSIFCHEKCRRKHNIGVAEPAKTHEGSQDIGAVENVDIDSWQR